MPAYGYEALNQKGGAEKGVIVADSLRDARKKLQAKSLYPIKVMEKSEAARRSFFSRQPKQSLPAKDLTMITRQLATMIGTGLPVDESLQAIAAQSDRPLVSNVLNGLRGKVLEGKRLSEAMQSESASFESLYRAMIAAGEASGDLGGVLERIADYCEKTDDVRRKVQAAMIYPAVLSIVAFSVLGILMSFVVPKIAKQFESFDADLPVLTRIVIGLSDAIIYLGPAFILLAGLCVGLYRYAMQRPEFRLKAHSFFLNLPLIGKLIRTVASARFARTLGTLVDGGSPVLESIQAARETQSNQILRNAVDEAYLSVREGASLAKSFGKSEVFSPLLVYMIAMGERSGSLAHLLIKTAEYLETEIDGFTRSLLSLLEPIIVIIMGLMVGTIVISIMLPIMKLNSLVLGG